MIKKVTLLAVTALLSLAFQASAHLITPAGNLVYNGPDSDASMSGHLGTPVSLLFKAEYDDGVLLKTEGDFGSYFTITLIDESTARISWNLTGSGAELLGVAWKDGNVRGQPGTGDAYLWSAVSADQRIIGGPETIVTIPIFTGAFSSISFYGVNVPEGGSTLAMLGLSLLGFETLRRKVRK